MPYANRLFRLGYSMIFAATLLAGCGKSNSLPLTPVAGTVTYQGKPLDHGMVVFVPEKGTPGPQATGVIGSDGRFQIRTLKSTGAAIGRFHVMVHCRLPARPEDAGKMIVPKLLIPEKYSSSNSPLHFEVKANGENDYSIALE